MKNFERTRAHQMLGLPFDVSLDELDERYLQLTLHFNGLDSPDDKDEAKKQGELVDEAYNTILADLIRGQGEAAGSSREEVTMKQVTNAQDRVHLQRISDHDMWIPPEASSAKLGPDRGEAPGFFMQEIEGDICDAPDRAVIVHAVNCQGVWGYGVAAQLKKKFPEAYSVYRSYCRRASKPQELLGTALLIAPQPDDYSEAEQQKAESEGLASSVLIEKRRWIACLFTSLGYGRPSIANDNPGKDSKERILRYTRNALEYLRVLLEEFGPSNFNEDTNWQTDDDKPGDIWCCKFNSGAFGVDWKETEAIVDQEFWTFERPWTVVEKVDKAKRA